MLVFTKIFTIFLQQILNSRLLQAVIDGEKIILMIGSIVNVALLKKIKIKIHIIFHNNWVGKFLLVLT